MWTMVRAAVLLVLFVQNVAGNGPECPGAAADIAFLLDGSGSVHSDDFNTMKTFVKSTIRSLLGQGQDTQFAVAQYSTNSTIHYHFDNLNTSGSWESQIDRIDQLRGSTYTAKAIQDVVQDIFVAKRGSRPDVNKFLIVITHGVSNDQEDLPNAASLAAKEGIIRFAIGVGSAFNDAKAKAELDIIATVPSKHVFRVTNFGALDGIRDTLQNNICPVEWCPGAAADIAFLLDASNSVSSSDFNTMKTFVKSAIRSLLGQGQVTQFAVAQYSTTSTIHYHFDNFTSSGSWESQIDSINQLGGGTNTAKAIQDVVQDVFVANGGSRPDVNKFLIVITDGASQDEKDLPNAVSEAEKKGIIRFAIGVGSAFNDDKTKKELDIIATEPLKHVFRVNNTGALDGIKDTLRKKICDIPEFSSLKWCPGAAADIAFLLDGSTSVDETAFNKTKTFVISAIRSLGQGQLTQFAVAQYSENPAIHYHFDEFNTSGSWETQIDRIKKLTGNTYTAKAIQHVVQDVFVANRGSRPNVNKFLIVITDGVSHDKEDLRKAASLAAEKGIIRFAIGVGSAFDIDEAKAELDDIATEPDGEHVFRVNDFGALDGIKETLRNRISCDHPPPPSPIKAGCPGAAADIAFLLDGSGSVHSDDFNTMKTFVTREIRSLLRLGQATQFAVAQYSTTSTIHNHFDNFNSSGSWESEIERIDQLGKLTYTARAIEHVVRDVFEGRGSRPNVNKFLIVISDGQSHDRNVLPNAASLAKKEGIIRFAIGVGSAFNDFNAKEELEITATDPSKHVFRVDNFKALDGIRDTLKNTICPVEWCPGAAADIAFLLDGSGSVHSDDFNTMKTFVKSTIHSLQGLGKKTQFAVAQYSTTSTIHNHFDNFNTSGSWESEIERINQLGELTYTARAIEHVVQNVFVANRGSRPNVIKFLIVITDGASHDRKDLPNAASLAKSEGIIRFAIGVGSAFNDANTKAELDDIATEPSTHVFRVTNFGALDGINRTLQNNICPVKWCPGAAADIAFLLDGSGSVSSSDFDTMKTFVRSAIRSLLGLGQVTQFAVAQYSTTSTIHYHFDNFTTSASWESRIDRIDQIRGKTYTAKAIEDVVKDVFLAKRGSRPNVNKFLIVITDGVANDRKDLPNAASLAKRKGIIRFAIGVGTAFNDEEELDVIATEPSMHVFRVTNFGALDGIRDTLQNSICPV